MRLDWSAWLYGLLAGFIGGGASSVVSAIAASGLAPGQFNLAGGEAGWNTLKLMGISFILNGILTAAAFLKQSPLPPVEPAPKPLDMNPPKP